MDDVELIKRLRERALNSREYWENYERGGSMDDLCDADLEVAAEQEQAASRIASLSAVIARVEALESFGATVELTTLLGTREMVTGAEVEVVSAAQLRAALAERGANDKHEL